MKIPPLKVTTVSKSVSTYELDRNTIISMLTETGFLEKFPQDAEIVIYAKVPGGGDWSNMRLEFDVDSKLFVQIKTTHQVTT